MLATIPIDRISVGQRLRPADEQQVARLMESIAEVGLLNPITVAARDTVDGGIAVAGYGIVAGLHRLEACKRLGLAEIEANIIALPELKRQLAECDENLCGTKLSPAERALFTRRRKEIYEALHPETRQGGAPGLPGGGKAKNDNLSSFAADTAAKTGVDRRTVERDAARGERIADDALAAVKGTSLDKGVELDALARLDADRQRELAARAKAGEPVSARSEVRLPDDPLNDFESVQKQVAALMSAWNKAGPEAREQFLETIDRPVFDRSRAGSAAA